MPPFASPPLGPPAQAPRQARPNRCPRPLAASLQLVHPSGLSLRLLLERQTSTGVPLRPLALVPELGAWLRQRVSLHDQAIQLELLRGLRVSELHPAWPLRQLPLSTRRLPELLPRLVPLWRQEVWAAQTLAVAPSMPTAQLEVGLLLPLHALETNGPLRKLAQARLVSLAWQIWRLEVLRQRSKHLGAVRDLGGTLQEGEVGRNGQRQGNQAADHVRNLDEVGNQAAAACREQGVLLSVDRWAAVALPRRGLRCRCIQVAAAPAGRNGRMQSPQAELSARVAAHKHLACPRLGPGVLLVAGRGH